MRYEFLIKTNCVACLGVIKELIKKISGVKSVDFESVDSETGKVIINYEGSLNYNELAKMMEEKTGYHFIINKS